jgi:hypothetical protein
MISMMLGGMCPCAFGRCTDEQQKQIGVSLSASTRVMHHVYRADCRAADVPAVAEARNWLTYSSYGGRLS